MNINNLTFASLIQLPKIPNHPLLKFYFSISLITPFFFSLHGLSPMWFSIFENKMLFTYFSKILYFADIAPALVKSTFVNTLMLLSVLVRRPHGCRQPLHIFPAPASPLPHCCVLLTVGTDNVIHSTSLQWGKPSRTTVLQIPWQSFIFQEMKDHVCPGHHRVRCSSHLPLFFFPSSWSFYLTSNLYLVKSLFSSPFPRKRPWMSTPISYTVSKYLFLSDTWIPSWPGLIEILWLQLSVFVGAISLFALFQCGTREPAEVSLCRGSVLPPVLVWLLPCPGHSGDFQEGCRIFFYSRWIVSSYLIIAFSLSVPFYPAGMPVIFVMRLLDPHPNLLYPLGLPPPYNFALELPGPEFGITGDSVFHQTPYWIP